MKTVECDLCTRSKGLQVMHYAQTSEARKRDVADQMLAVKAGGSG